MPKTKTPQSPKLIPQTDFPMPDLSPLPDGFRRQVERWFRGAPLDNPDFRAVLIAHVIGVVWQKSTARQRGTAEPGVIKVLLAEVVPDPHAARALGRIAATCIDLDMNDLANDEAGEGRAWTFEDDRVLGGIYDGGGIRVNVEVEAVVEGIVKSY